MTPARRRFAALLAAAFLALPAATGAGPADGAAVTVERSVCYTTAGGEKLCLDIAVPPGEGPFPAVVMFHGGAWALGDRAELSVGAKEKNGGRKPSWIEVVADKGYVAASVSYRLAPKHQFPAMIEDARSAVRFLRANAKAYKIDPDRVAAAGFSAGGHLALLCGLCDKSAGFDKGDHLDHSGQVQCVVDFFGPTDLAMYAQGGDIEDGYLVPVFGKECKTDPKVYQKASPVTYVSKDAPPVLMVHGTFDLIVPVKHSEDLHQKLTAAGAKSELVTIPFGGHGGWGPRDMAKAQDAVFKFLDAHLKGKK
jgi:acetyl esterase/lipase